VSNQETIPVVVSPVKSAAARIFNAIRYLMSAAAQVNINQAAMWLVCLVFLSVVLAPTVIMTLVMNHSAELKASEEPDFAQRMVIYLIRGAGDEFSRLTNFITPVFALLAGLKSKTGAQSMFFTLFVCLSLFGAVGSLLVEYFILSPDGQALFGGKETWVGKESIVEWSQKAKTFYGTSFQTFLSFIAILLGLQVAGK
jgi:hypothetical protein